MKADVIDYKIYGSEMQLVEVDLDPSEGIRAEAGAMMYMDEGITMQTNAEGGLFKGFKRMLTGESFFITTFINQARGVKRMAFAAPFPGKIIPLHLGEIGPFYCQKDSFLCAANGIDIDIAFTKRFGAGLFGGEGFILQKLSGDGLVFIHAGGTVIKRELASGESLMLDTGCLVGFTQGVDYDIQFSGGFKNAMFGGEGLFLTKLTGPGTVYLQSLPFARLADRIRSTFGSRKEETRGVGGLLGNLISGD